MKNNWIGNLGVRVLLSLLCMGGLPLLAQAQNPAAQSIRVRAVIQSVETNALVLKTREGEVARVIVPDDLQVSEVYPVSMDLIQPNSFIGTTAIPQKDGTLLAIEIHVFPESLRGAGEGHRPWDLLPESSMTNATVADMVTAVQGRQLKLQYKDGEKTVIATDKTVIVSYRPGDRSLLKPGAGVFLMVTPADGQLKATRVTVGRDGFMPPM